MASHLKILGYEMQPNGPSAELFDTILTWSYGPFIAEMYPNYQDFINRVIAGHLGYVRLEQEYFLEWLTQKIQSIRNLLPTSSFYCSTKPIVDELDHLMGYISQIGPYNQQGQVYLSERE